MVSVIYSSVALVCGIIVIVHGETEWVWSKNRTPHTSSSSSGKNNQNLGQSNFNNGLNNQNLGQSNFNNGLNNPNLGQSNFNNGLNNQNLGQSNFNNGLNNNFGSSIPQSPSRPGFQQTTNSNNDATLLPAGTIRVVNSQGEARLIPGALNFVTNALQGGGNNGGGGGGGIGGSNGLIGIGSGLLSSILSNGPQIASSAFNFLLGRAPGNGNNGVNTLPASGSSFPSSINTGGTSSFPSSSSNFPSSSSNFPASTSTNSGNCQCIDVNQCFLPFRPNGSCGGGNIMCCQTSGGTRTIFEDSSAATKDGNSNPTKSIRTPLDVRVGLIENIVRGSSSIVDDALDLVLQPFLTDEDKQKLATRLSTNKNG